MLKVIRKVKNIGHLALAFIANSYFGNPSVGLKVIGVTGTDGKTTTASLIYHILRANGSKAALISTLGAEIDGKSYETGFHVTTPSSFQIQKYLKLAREKKCDYVILEVTSHALDQYRVWGIKFHIAILTNVTHEHLDYHGNYINYVMTKLRLLKNADLSVVNSDGEWFSTVEKTIPKEKLLTYSLHGRQKSDLSLVNLPFKIKTKLIGDFNIENIIGASKVCLELGVVPSKIDKAIESFKAPEGRQQIIETKKLASIMIDFAHTPNAFEKILPEVRKRTPGRLIHVFGCAGKRDMSKRPEMGKVASFYDDVIILTAEDPRRESILKINKEIIAGIDERFVFATDHEATVKPKVVYEIFDREEAIKFALSLAGNKDMVVITGKGHEKSINYGKGEEPWSDEGVVRKILNNEKN